MKPELRMGLIGAGGVTRSFLSRMPVLLGRIGPVKASSFRVARRIANSLRAGNAVTSYSELAGCSLLWISVPDTGLDRLFRDLAAATPLAGKTVVLCGSTRDSFWPSPLLAAGARVVTLNCVEESHEKLFVAEGDPEAMRDLRRLMASERRRLIELRAASKALYLAGTHLASHLLLPWIAASVESLRLAGFSRAEATRLASALGAKALRSYGKAGSKAWSPSAADQLGLSIARDLETIRGADAKLAALYAGGVEQVLGYFAPRKRAAGR
ncbi:MAG TPA: hypothetical protein VMT15_08455 [Bryobacteraceae bacterium]|nr:hypothetical protein [Bryobacteraceae bacterium]